MTDTDTLRRAAALVRERAKCGDPGQFPTPWTVAEADVEQYGVSAFVHCDDGKGDVTDALDPLVAAHIAGMHPGVALALADWLDAVHQRLEGDTDTRLLGYADIVHALRVARTILGDTP